MEYTNALVMFLLYLLCDITPLLKLITEYFGTFFDKSPNIDSDEIFFANISDLAYFFHLFPYPNVIFCLKMIDNW